MPPATNSIEALRSGIDWHIFKAYLHSRRIGDCISLLHIFKAYLHGRFPISWGGLGMSLSNIVIAYLYCIALLHMFIAYLSERFVGDGCPAGLLKEFGGDRCPVGLLNKVRG